MRVVEKLVGDQQLKLKDAKILQKKSIQKTRFNGSSSIEWWMVVNTVEPLRCTQIYARFNAWIVNVFGLCSK